jgi:predicted ATPase with chaperone activity
MHTRQIRTYCELSPEPERLLERAMQQQGLSARAHDRVSLSRLLDYEAGAEFRSWSFMRMLFQR